jgi:hypothetical protein
MLFAMSWEFSDTEVPKFHPKERTDFQRSLKFPNNSFVFAGHCDDADEDDCVIQTGYVLVSEDDSLSIKQSTTMNFGKMLLQTVTFPLSGDISSLLDYAHENGLNILHPPIHFRSMPPLRIHKRTDSLRGIHLALERVIGIPTTKRRHTQLFHSVRVAQLSKPPRR